MASAATASDTMSIVTLDSPKGMSEIGDFVWQQASAAIEARGAFVVAVSGGSLPKVSVCCTPRLLCALKTVCLQSFGSETCVNLGVYSTVNDAGLQNLAAGLVATASSYAASCPAAKWTIVYADERFVALDDAESNHAATAASLTASGMVLEGANLIPIDPAQASVEACAADYEAKLSSVVSTSTDGGIPVVDLVLLGMGPDGHTASLFPGHALLEESGKAVAAIRDSPKPPPQRVTLTLPVLNSARAVAFICTGAAKAEALASVQAVHNGTLPAGEAALPSARVHKAVWFVDAAAAVGLAPKAA
jgi:6-phosphogluconolactonase